MKKLTPNEIEDAWDRAVKAWGVAGRRPNTLQLYAAAELGITVEGWNPGDDCPLNSRYHPDDGAL